MHIKDLTPANSNLYMEFPNGPGKSMEEMFGVTEQRASDIADAIRDKMQELVPNWSINDEDFVANLPAYVQAASIICETPKELSFFMMKLGGFTADHGLVYQDPEEVARKTRDIMNRGKSNVN